jgi:hypothetical protein
MDKSAARELMEGMEKLKYNSAGDNSKSRKARGEYNDRMRTLQKLNTSPNFIGQLIGEQRKSIRAKQAKLGKEGIGNKEKARLESEVKYQEEIIADLRALAKKNLKKEGTAKRFLKKNMKLRRKSGASRENARKYNKSISEIENLGLSGEEIEELLPRADELREEIKNREDREALDNFLARLRAMDGA